MIEGQQIETNENAIGTSSTILNVISFLIPLVGAFIYFSNKKTFPIKAKAAGRAALVGMVFGLVLNLLML